MSINSQASKVDVLWTSVSDITCVINLHFMCSKPQLPCSECIYRHLLLKMNKVDEIHPSIQPFTDSKEDHVLRATKENSRVRTNETANETTRCLREIQGKALTGDSSLTEAIHHVSQALITYFKWCC